MDFPRFEQLLDLHGSNLEAWPSTEQDAARQLLRDSPSAAELHRAQQAVDEALSQAPALQPSATLERRIHEVPLRYPQRTRSLIQAISFRPAFLFAAACACAGAVTGWFAPVELSLADPAISETEEIEQLDSLAMSSDLALSVLELEGQ